MAIVYPYLPEGRAFKFVPDGHPFLEQAKQARTELAGDPIWPNGAVLVKDGAVVAKAGNGFNRGAHLIHICSRIVEDCPSGQGDELCSLHDSDGHAERMVIKKAQEEGVDPAGADVYMYGHWWCCKPCWDAMVAAGIRDVYLLNGAHEEFTREKVHAPYLVPQIKKISLLGNDLEHICDSVSCACKEIGCALSLEAGEEDDVVIVHFGEEGVAMFSHVKSLGKPVVLFSLEGTEVPEEILKDSLLAYHFVYRPDARLQKKIKNILIQF